jgi:hypothetical protein
MSKNKIISKTRVIDYLVVVYETGETYAANIMSGDEIVKTITCYCADECRDCAIRFVVNYL